MSLPVLAERVLGQVAAEGRIGPHSMREADLHVTEQSLYLRPTSPHGHRVDPVGCMRMPVLTVYGNEVRFWAAPLFRHEVGVVLVQIERDPVNHVWVIELQKALRDGSLLAEDALESGNVSSVWPCWQQLKEVTGIHG